MVASAQGGQASNVNREFAPHSQSQNLQGKQPFGRGQLGAMERTESCVDNAPSYNESKDACLTSAKEGHDVTSRHFGLFPPRHILQKLAKGWRCWANDWSEFASRNSDCPALNVEPLYSLPDDLLHSIEKHVPGWLTHNELSFERDLQQLCQQHNAVGIMNNRPACDRILHRLPPPVLSDDLLQELGWGYFWTPIQARQRMQNGLERIDPIFERLDAYRGWLFSNPLFLNELQELKARWESAVVKLGSIPPFPVQDSEYPMVRQPRKGRDVTDAFASDFNSFYGRWELEGLATWDLPQPRSANLSGEPVPASVASTSTMVTLQVSPILPLPASFSLRTIVEEVQRSQSPSHLDGWFQVQKQQHAGDLGYTRFRRMFLVYFYRDTVLTSRYSRRIAGHVEDLDLAFGQYLGNLGADTVKKLRTVMKALRDRN